MLDSIIKLSEKIVELANYRANQRKMRFDQIVNPMYAVMKEVHKDYLQIFQKARSDISSGIPIANVAKELEIRRLDEEAERRAILRQAETMLVLEGLEDLRPFLGAVKDYFEKTPFSRKGTPSNTFVQILFGITKTNAEYLASEEKQNELVEYLQRSLVDVTESLRRNWERVSEEYAKSIAATVK
jgi:hypothetical protein